MRVSAESQHWSAFRPWQTNAALIVLGLSMFLLTRQLIIENDGFQIGFSGVSSSHLVVYCAALLVLLLKPANTNRYTFPIILTVAIVCRLVALFPEPFLSSDVYRYAWDGVVQHAHISPFRYVPGDAALTFLREPNQDLFDHMNRRDYAHTIYPPVAQMVFYLITWISPTVTFMKMAMVLFEGLTLFALLKLLRLMNLPRGYSLIYLWCPLLIWEIGGSGHVDSVVMAFLMLAVLFRFKRVPVLTGLFLGLAVFTKFYPVVLFPAFYQRTREGRLDWKMPAAMASVAVVSYSFYLSAGKLVFGFLGGYVKEEGIATGERYYLLDQAQHAVNFLRGGRTVPAEPSSYAFLFVSGLLFAALAVWACKVAWPADSPRTAFLAPALALACALMLLFSPHYPWYVAWLIPFLVLRPSVTVFTYICGLFYLCTTSMAVGSGPQQYHLNQILYSALCIAAVVELALRRRPHTSAWFERWEQPTLQMPHESH